MSRLRTEASLFFLSFFLSFLTISKRNIYWSFCTLLHLLISITHGILWHLISVPLSPPPLSLPLSHTHILPPSVRLSPFPFLPPSLSLSSSTSLEWASWRLELEELFCSGGPVACEEAQQNQLLHSLDCLTRSKNFTAADWPLTPKTTTMHNCSVVIHKWEERIYYIQIDQWG